MVAGRTGAPASLPKNSHCAAHPVTAWQYWRRRDWNTSSLSSAHCRPASSRFRCRYRNTASTTTAISSVLQDSQAGRHYHHLCRGRRRHEICEAHTTGNPPRSSSRSICSTSIRHANSAQPTPLFRRSVSAVHVGFDPHAGRCHRLAQERRHQRATEPCTPISAIPQRFRPMTLVSWLPLYHDMGLILGNLLRRLVAHAPRC